MKRLLGLLALLAASLVDLAGAQPPAPAKVAVGEQAPTFKIKDASGKVIDLAELTAKGPVLVRLTCGCAGCDKELTYFQGIHEAYKGQGLTSLFIFKEPDAKVAKYAEDKKLNMLYAVDAKGESWNVFQTKTMPTNFLIEKGGKISAIAAGCDTSGLLANRVSEKAAKLVGSDPVDVQKSVRSDQKDEKQDNAKLIVGTWEVSKADKDAPLVTGDTAEFTKDGKNKTTRKTNDKERVSEGTYKFEKEKLVITFKSDKGTSENVLTIKKLTDAELVISHDEGGRVIEFKRKK
jgi:uncharacterized protein (TIGR03066 family)